MIATPRISEALVGRLVEAITDGVIPREMMAIERPDARERIRGEDVFWIALETEGDVLRRGELLGHVDALLGKGVVTGIRPPLGQHASRKFVAVSISRLRTFVDGVLQALSQGETSTVSLGAELTQAKIVSSKADEMAAKAVEAAERSLPSSRTRPAVMEKRRKEKARTEEKSIEARARMAELEKCLQKAENDIQDKVKALKTVLDLVGSVLSLLQDELGSVFAKHNETIKSYEASLARIGVADASFACQNLALSLENARLVHRSIGDSGRIDDLTQRFSRAEKKARDLESRLDEFLFNMGLAEKWETFLRKRDLIGPWKEWTEA